jgi:hypothetical protein
MTQSPFYSAPFRQFGGNEAISASTTTARAALDRAKDQTAVVSNSISGSVAFVRFGDDAVEATAADFPVLPGQQRVLDIPARATHVAVILNTGTGTVYVTIGDGSVI